jgi:hypothetical protein
VHLPSWTAQIIFYKYAHRVSILFFTATEDINKYQYNTIQYNEIPILGFLGDQRI